MKYVRLGAKIGVICPLLLVASLWLIQFVISVLAPDRDGPDWRGFAFTAILTLLWASPLLLVGAVIGATVGTISRAFSPRAMTGPGKHGQAEPSDAAD